MNTKSSSMASIIAVIIAQLDGAERARTLAIASVVLWLWDWLITLDVEVEVFWKGKSWTISRVLYFANRLMTLVTLLFGLPAFLATGWTPTQCKIHIEAGALMTILTLSIIQAIITLRVWYLFSGSVTVRLLAFASFVICLGTSIALVTITCRSLQPFSWLAIQQLFPEFRPLGCAILPTNKIYRMFTPGLVLHTLLFAFTTARALMTKDLFRTSPVMKRILRDGGLFYLVVMISVGFTSIASFFVNVPKLSNPAVWSNSMLALSSLSVARLMQSFHELAANLGTDAQWLLNNVELSRVPWKPGMHEGELLVEISRGDDDDTELTAGSSRRHRNGYPARHYSLKATRIGELEPTFPPPKY